MYNLLVVDDDLWMRKYVKENIEWSRYNVTVVGEAADGNDAYEKLLKMHVDILLVDISMPGLDGFELSELAVKMFGVIKIILISGHREFEYARRAVGMGILDYILKPVDEEKLVEVVKRAVKELDSTWEKENKKEAASCNAVIPGRSLVKDVLELIENKYSENLYLENIAQKFDVHPAYLSRKFKAETGENLIAYLMKIRIEKSKPYLCNPGIKVYEVASIVGYENMRTFTRIFKTFVGMTPSDYRDKFCQYLLE